MPRKKSFTLKTPDAPASVSHLWTITKLFGPQRSEKTGQECVDTLGKTDMTMQDASDVIGHAFESGMKQRYDWFEAPKKAAPKTKAKKTSKGMAAFAKLIG